MIFFFYMWAALYDNIPAVWLKSKCYEQLLFPCVSLLELAPMSTLSSAEGGKNIKGLENMPCNERSTEVFQEGPPVCWLFLPGRLFVGWSALIGKTFGWPISPSIVTAASDKARPASRKPEIYPPAFHHSFTISAQRERQREQEGAGGV